MIDAAAFLTGERIDWSSQNNPVIGNLAWSSVSSVPEPSSALLAACWFAGLGLKRRIRGRL